MRSLITLCSLLLALMPADSGAQPREVLRVVEILIDGKPVPSAQVPQQVTVEAAPGTSAVQMLERGQALGNGTRLGTGVGVRVELASVDGRQRIALQPRSRLTVRDLSDRSTRLDLDQGRAGFSLLRQLDFHFSVGSLKSVFAIAKGTRFTVEAHADCKAADSTQAPCVALELEEGQLAVETHRPVQIGPGLASRPVSRLDEAADRVILSDTLLAGQSRQVSLDPQAYALRFASWAEADRHFAAELQRAREQTDPEVLLRALRNRALILRLGDQAEASTSAALEGQMLAQVRGARSWEFRFLVDRAYAIWLAQRDRAAWPLFEQAFAMKDTLDVPSTDLAALYGRYGGIRFDARDRANPAPDLDVAEAYLRLGLRLREAIADGHPTLDLAASHYGIGLLLRIGREDVAAAEPHLAQAVALRRAVLGPRDDITLVSMRIELAIATQQRLEQQVEAGRIDDSALALGLAAVQRQFEESLAMLGRLFPEGRQRAIGAVARRTADFHDRAARRWLSRGQSERAHAHDGAAAMHYRQALTVFDQVAGNTSAERRFALLGLGRTELRRGDSAAARAALLQALQLARQEQCARAPEAPSAAWLATLNELLAQTIGPAVTDSPLEPADPMSACGAYGEPTRSTGAAP